MRLLGLHNGYNITSKISHKLHYPYGISGWYGLEKEKKIIL